MAATANGFGNDASFTLLKLMHSHLTHLCSSNENKYEITDLNRVPYAVRFNKELANIFVVADENGFVKLFRTYPCLKPVKEFHVNKSCIYDIQWLTSSQIACGGGDKHVCVYDVNVGEQIAQLKGHTESVKSISQVPDNPFVLASGARDGAVLIYDLRCNKSTVHAVSSIAAGEQAASDESTISVIKPINNIAKAHYDLAHPATTSSVSTRLAKASTQASPSMATAQRRASPIGAIAYQSDNLLVSAGATDGLIKVWDTRKIYTPFQSSASSSKRSNSHHQEPIPPVYTLTALPGGSGVSNSDASTPSTASRASSKTSFSNILFNHARTRLYANCLNHQIYEYNFCTYMPRHTRVLNNPAFDDRPDAKFVKPHHLNQSNYIKSSVSMCDNFLLTGSSDSNAYIYPTHTNANLKRFRHHMPVLVLKGHNNEVTAVDWSPIDIDQLVTCSDDNVIRLWNCQRDLEKSMEKMKECCFLQAEVCYDKYDTDPELAPPMASDNQPTAPPACKRWYDDDSQFMPSLSAMSLPRLNNHFPHLYQVCDEFFLKNYDYKNFVCSVRQRLPRPPIESRTDVMDEPEATDAASSSQSSSQKNSQTLKKFKILTNLAQMPFADLPINIIEPDSEEMSEEMKVEPPVKPKFAWPLAMLPSSSSTSKTVKTSEGAKPPRPISVNRKAKTVNKPTSSTTAAETAVDSPKRQLRSRADEESSIKKSASKKRTLGASSSTPGAVFMNMSDLKTPLSIIESSSEVADSSRVSSPKSKKRLIMSEAAQEDAENSNDALATTVTPSTSSKVKPSTSKKEPRNVLQAKTTNTTLTPRSSPLPSSAKNSILNYFSKNVG